jgi:signal-transduction protein with cAMP-binding, CBS, and nucleotidyltransferase domain
VGLEIEINSSTRIRINDVNPNFTFGFSSMVETEQKLYISNSKALEDTSVFKWKASDLEKLFHENYEMGFYFMKKLAKTLKTRIQTRDAQLAQYI